MKNTTITTTNTNTDMKEAVIMTTTKMTKKDYFKMLLNIVEKSNTENKTDLVTFVNHEIELLNNKKSSSNNSKKEQERKAEQANIQTIILNVLENEKNGLTATEIQRANTELANYSLPKITAMIKKLVDSGSIIRTVEKKKAIFRIA
jgi:predicted transcriptional regulator